MGASGGIISTSPSSPSYRAARNTWTAPVIQLSFSSPAFSYSFWVNVTGPKPDSPAKPLTCRPLNLSRPKRHITKAPKRLPTQPLMGRFELNGTTTRRRSSRRGCLGLKPFELGKKMTEKDGQCHRRRPSSKMKLRILISLPGTVLMIRESPLDCDMLTGNSR